MASLGENLHGVFLSREHLASFWTADGEWAPEGLELPVSGVFESLVAHCNDELFGTAGRRFIALRLPLALLNSPAGPVDSCISQDLAGSETLCDALFRRGDDVKAAMLRSMLASNLVATFPQYFPAQNLGCYRVAGRHDKLSTYHTPSGEVRTGWPHSAAGEPEKPSLGLHWDPLQVTVLATTYHRDRGVEGGGARVADLQAYLRRHGNLRVGSSGTFVPLCTHPYPPKLDDGAIAQLEADYQTHVPLYYDCITLLFLVNHSELSSTYWC